MGPLHQSDQRKWMYGRFRHVRLKAIRRSKPKAKKPNATQPIVDAPKPSAVKRFQSFIESKAQDLSRDKQDK